MLVQEIHCLAEIVGLDIKVWSPPKEPRPVVPLPLPSMGLLAAVSVPRAYTGWHDIWLVLSTGPASWTHEQEHLDAVEKHLSPLEQYPHWGILWLGELAPRWATTGRKGATAQLKSLTVRLTDATMRRVDTFAPWCRTLLDPADDLKARWRRHNQYIQGWIGLGTWGHNHAA